MGDWPFHPFRKDKLVSNFPVLLWQDLKRCDDLCHWCVIYAWVWVTKIEMVKSVVHTSTMITTLLFNLARSTMSCDEFSLPLFYAQVSMVRKNGYIYIRVLRSAMFKKSSPTVHLIMMRDVYPWSILLWNNASRLSTVNAEILHER